MFRDSVGETPPSSAAIVPYHLLALLSEFLALCRSFQEEQYFPFEVSELPYSYVGLVPRCDANTLYYHHDKYYEGCLPI